MYRLPKPIREGNPFLEKCGLCGKQRGDHLAETLACPTKEFNEHGFVAFSKDDFFVKTGITISIKH